MRILTLDHYEAHADYLRAVREFFHSRDFLEVETPLLNSCGAVEAHLDSLLVQRQGIRKSPDAPEAHGRASDAPAGYLITSPEYNLKIVLAHLKRSLFQVAHSFREGDIGPIHSEEFLMLEWYLVGADEFALMDQCEELLRHLCAQNFCRISLPSETFARRSVTRLLQQYADCPDFSRASIIAALQRDGLLDPSNSNAPDSPKADVDATPYEDLFFSLFLNRVEPHLGRTGPEFVYDYPPELAALSRVTDGRARRFEIYWDRIELANGYYELNDGQEQRRRFVAENLARRAAGKPEMQPDPQFLAALDHGLPDCSGVALGLDRLFMLLRNARTLDQVSIFT